MLLLLRISNINFTSGTPGLHILLFWFGFMQHSPDLHMLTQLGDPLFNAQTKMSVNGVLTH